MHNPNGALLPVVRQEIVQNKRKREESFNLVKFLDAIRSTLNSEDFHLDNELVVGLQSSLASLKPGAAQLPIKVVKFDSVENFLEDQRAKICAELLNRHFSQTIDTAYRALNAANKTHGQRTKMEDGVKTEILKAGDAFFSTLLQKIYDCSLAKVSQQLGDEDKIKEDFKAFATDSLQCWRDGIVMFSKVEDLKSELRRQMVSKLRDNVLASDLTVFNRCFVQRAFGVFKVDLYRQTDVLIQGDCTQLIDDELASREAEIPSFIRDEEQRGQLGFDFGGAGDDDFI